MPPATFALKGLKPLFNVCQYPPDLDQGRGITYGQGRVIDEASGASLSRSDIRSDVLNPVLDEVLYLLGQIVQFLVAHRILTWVPW